MNLFWLRAIEIWIITKTCDPISRISSFIFNGARRTWERNHELRRDSQNTGLEWAWKVFNCLSTTRQDNVPVLKDKSLFNFPLRSTHKQLSRTIEEIYLLPLTLMKLSLQVQPNHIKFRWDFVLTIRYQLQGIE